MSAVPRPATRDREDRQLAEVAARARRELESRLARSGLWVPQAEALATIRRQRARGHVLSRQLLLPCLGSDDFARLSHNAPFGVPHAMLRDRLGLIASFGYEVGRGLQQLLGQDPFSSRSGPELCCLLNTGVSLFDLQCDRGPGGAMELGAVFDEDTLADLIAKPHACRALAARADLTAELELRVLLKIIAQVFARLHEGRRPGREDAWGIMATLLANAYRAQVLHGAAKADRLRSAEVKSTAPFYLMVEVFRVLSTAADDTWPRIHRLVGDMAVAFWLVDDVADLLRDVSSGAANSILLRVASGEPADRVIEEVVDRVVAALRDTSALLLTLGGDALAFRWIVLCYVRSWLR